MTIERHQVEESPEGRAAWLKLREGNVNASEVGALFGDHPYLTAFELYTNKTGLIKGHGPDEGVLRRGRILEGGVAQAVAEARPDWRITKATHYLSDRGARIGATPDFIVECPRRGRGVLQTKTCGPMPAQMAHWGVSKISDGEHEASPPLWIQLQTLTEQMLEDVSWGAIGAMLIDGNTLPLRICEFDRHTAAEGRLIAAVAKFWTDAAGGVAPTPNYARDNDVVRALYPNANGETLDLSADNRIQELLAEYDELQTRTKADDAAMKAVKTEIFSKLGHAGKACLPGWIIKAPTISTHGYTVGPKTYRRLTICRTH